MMTSGPFRSYNDDSRVLRKLDSRIEGTYQAVLHDTRHGQRTASDAAEVSLDRRSGCVGGQLKGRQLRFDSDLLISSPPPRAPLVNTGLGHRVFLPIRGDHEDRQLAQLSEDVRDPFILPVVAPDDPDAASRRCRGKHLEGAVLAFLEAEDA